MLFQNCLWPFYSSIVKTPQIPGTTKTTIGGIKFTRKKDLWSTGTQYINRLKTFGLEGILVHCNQRSMNQNSEFPDTSSPLHKNNQIQGGSPEAANSAIIDDPVLTAEIKILSELPILIREHKGCLNCFTSSVVLTCRLWN